jgi:hypothetical protein
MFEDSSIDVIVGRIAVHEFIEEESVEWESPVLRAWLKRVVLPEPSVVKRIHSRWVLVEIVSDIVLIVMQGRCEGGDRT